VRRHDEEQLAAARRRDGARDHLLDRRRQRHDPERVVADRVAAEREHAQAPGEGEVDRRRHSGRAKAHTVDDDVAGRRGALD